MNQVPAHFYTQSAVIPFRLEQGEFRILLISSRRKRRWVIPKGVKEPGLSAPESAAKEALEEAGIEGRVQDRPVGRYHYEKWGGVCHVEVYPMAVERVLERWDESYRDREWVSLEEAVRRVEEPQLKALIGQLPQLVQGDG
jgi:phosphohistidine phosphatase